MIQKGGLAWDCATPFQRYIEDCGVQCELITPQMMAAPYYRGSLVSIIIPTGFGNLAYSSLLPALRASSKRIEKFLKNGGNLLVFGAMTPKPDAYDWMPVPITYVNEYFSTPITVDPHNPHARIMDDFDLSSIECDGYFSEFCGEILATTEDGRAIMISHEIGKGTLLVTSLHEYPSRGFIRGFSSGETETLF